MGKTRVGPIREDVADRLHSLAIHLLRRARDEDPSSGLSPARLSALSVVVYAGPIRLSDLAAAEQVRPPTMTRLVQGLEGDGLVRRRAVKGDARGWLIESTARGRDVLGRARERRLRVLRALLEPLRRGQLDDVSRVIETLEPLVTRP